jgi:hypothetical protein
MFGQSLDGKVGVTVAMHSQRHGVFLESACTNVSRRGMSPLSFGSNPRPLPLLPVRLFSNCACNAVYA